MKLQGVSRFVILLLILFLTAFASNANADTTKFRNPPPPVLKFLPVSTERTIVVRAADGANLWGYPEVRFITVLGHLIGVVWIDPISQKPTTYLKVNARGDLWAIWEIRYFATRICFEGRC
jgi:hypothetical protein